MDVGKPIRVDFQDRAAMLKDKSEKCDLAGFALGDILGDFLLWALLKHLLLGFFSRLLRQIQVKEFQN